MVAGSPLARVAAPEAMSAAQARTASRGIMPAHSVRARKGRQEPAWWRVLRRAGTHGSRHGAAPRSMRDRAARGLLSRLRVMPPSFFRTATLLGSLLLAPAARAV